MSYRVNVIERDFSGFALPLVSEVGGMVIVSPKGRVDKPILCQSEKDVITHFGTPSASYPALFEAVAFCREAACYIVSSVGENALYGGVAISENTLSGVAEGIANPDNYTFADNSYSHILCTTGPWDSNLYVSVVSKGGKKFKATLYELNGTIYSEIRTYEYSLIREKDNFGTSLYYGDVFNEDTYIKFIYNPNTEASDYTSLSGTAKYKLEGGSRGDTPASSDISESWKFFQSANKYPVNIFMDVFGNYAEDLNTLIQTYQPYAQGISVIPKNKTVAQMVSYRNELALDTDDICLYANWTKIVDPYNNSFAWISNVGSVGRAYARMADVYDGLSPAGINENNHGGQLSDWKPVEVELDFSDYDLQTLDEAQINPVVLDEIYGLMIYGDKTLQRSLSDTSFVGTRRLYKLIQKNIIRQILRRQEFKNNDAYHRYKAKAMAEDMLSPIVALQLLREVAVVCDETNNDNIALEQRKFILSIYVKVTPNSQFVILNFTRLSQTQTIAEFLTQ